MLAGAQRAHVRYGPLVLAATAHGMISAGAPQSGLGQAAISIGTSFDP